MEAKQAKKKLFEEIQKLALIGNWKWNIKTDEISWSDELYEIFGLEPKSKMSYQKFIRHVHPEDRKFVQSIIINSIKINQPFEFCFRIIDSNGTIKVIHKRGIVVVDKQGATIKLQGTVQNITELKKAENALLRTNELLDQKAHTRAIKLEKTVLPLKKEIFGKKKAQEELRYEKEKLRMYLEIASVIFLLIDKQQQVDLINKKGCEILGYSENEIIGKNWFNLALPKEQKDRSKTIFDQIMQGEAEPEHYSENTLITKSGNRKIIAWYNILLRDKDGFITGMLCSGQDITENKKLSEKQAALASIVESSEDAIIGKTLEGVITSWNKGAEKIYGFTEQEMLGKPIFTIIPPEKVKEVKVALGKIKKGEIVRFEETIRLRKNKKRIYVSTTISPIMDPQGNITGASAISKDITFKKLAEDAIKESELRFRTLVETMNEGVLNLDNKDIIQFTNKKFCNITGYSEKELIGRKASGLVLSPEGKKIQQEATKKKNRSVQYELPLKTKSGGIRWMLVNSTPVLDKTGKITGSTNIYADITDRKNYEKELDDIARFSAENPNPVIRVDNSGKVLYANKAAAPILKNLKAKKGTHLPEKWKQITQTVLVSAKDHELEFTFNHKVFSLILVPINEGRYVNIYGRDITIKKQTLEEFRKLSIAVSKTKNSIIITDKNGRIEWVNDGFVRLTGYSFKEVKGTSGEILRKGEKTGITQANEIFQRLTREKRALSYESLNYSKRGRPFWVYTTLTPIFDKEGNIDKIVVVDSDITEKKKVENELVKAKELAEASAHSKESFLMNMSHEIRTPMNAILGIAQLLEDTRLTQTQAKYLKAINFASQNLMRIINDILDLSKIEAQKVEIENIHFNINDLLTCLCESMEFRASEKKLHFETELDKNIPEIVCGDPTRLNQILINLLENAVKFTNKGEIKLSADVVNKRNNKVGICFKVADTGIGIPEHKLKTIFDAFEQAESDTSRRFGGTGLGLTIVKRLTELLGGRIIVNSKTGKGTEFSLTLHFKVAGTSGFKAQTTNPADYLHDRLSNKKALLVEDNQLNQMVAERFMIDWGINVDIAENGKAAIQKIKKNLYDIILMDIQMPEMNGYEATKIIRQKLKAPKNKTPILAMTAHAFHGEEEKCKKAGMNSYISKPLRREELINKIASLVCNK